MDGALNEVEGSAQVPQANIASTHLPLHLGLDLPIELQDMPLLILADAAYVFIDEAPGVAINDVPKISLVLQLAHVEFSEFAAE